MWREAVEAEATDSLEYETSYQLCEDPEALYLADQKAKQDAIDQARREAEEEAARIEAERLEAERIVREAEEQRLREEEKARLDAIAVNEAKVAILVAETKAAQLKAIAESTRKATREVESDKVDDERVQSFTSEVVREEVFYDVTWDDWSKTDGWVLAISAFIILLILITLVFCLVRKHFTSKEDSRSSDEE